MEMRQGNSRLWLLLNSNDDFRVSLRLSLDLESAKHRARIGNVRSVILRRVNLLNNMQFDAISTLV